MQATVDKELCIGCGLCAETCPEVFEMSDDMIAKVIVAEVSAALKDCAQAAADICPVEAIAIA